MAEGKSITKKSELKLPPALDFNFLKMEGISYIQDLSGDVWTDYNEHDPGVTILEQLCYAITDLAYRAEYDIKDLIASTEDIDKSTFYTAAEILTCNPVTTTDLAKVIIDKVEDVACAWPVPSGIPGLYTIYIEVNDVRRKEQVVQHVWRVVNAHRNLCEGVKEVIVLEKRKIRLTGEVEIEAAADVNEVLAEIFYHVDHYLSHPVHFYSLHSMREAGYQVNEIFNGPKLDHGFIRDENLYPRRKEIRYSTLIKIILEVKGVKSVRKFGIEGGSNDRLELTPAREVPVLDTNIEREDTAESLRLVKRDVRNDAEQELVERRLKMLKAEHNRQYHVKVDGYNDIDVPKGRKRDISRYNSIQNQFPKIYGIAKGGMPASKPPRRKAQAKQLKAYLLFFEQLAVNYLAQLENAAHLFSIDKSIEQTYFSCEIGEEPEETYDDKPREEPGKAPVPDVVTYDLLKTGMEQGVAGAVNETKRRVKLVETPRNYSEGLKYVVKDLDNFDDRRDRIINHLLARFGERITGQSILNFNYYDSPEVFRKKFIDQRLEFLAVLPEMSRNRARGFDTTQRAWGTANRAGLEQKVDLILGFSGAAGTFTPRTTSLSEVVLNKLIWFRRGGYEMQENTDLVRPIMTEIRGSRVDEKFQSVDDIELDEKWFALADNNAVPPANPSWYIDEDILEGGFDVDRYRFGPATDDPGHKWAVVYQLNDKKTWRRIDEYQNEKEAKNAIKQLARYIRYLNIESEGYHIVEHLLLRTDERNKVRFDITDRSGYVFLASAHLYHESRKEEVIGEIFRAAQKQENFFIYRDKISDKYILQLRGNKRTLAMHPREFATREEAERERIKVFTYLVDMLRSHYHALQHFVKTSAKTMPVVEIEEDFYDFTITVVLPSWPARFRDKEFRKSIRRAFSTSAPAHIAVNYLWLDVFDMYDFEVLYQDWLKALERKEEARDELDRLSSEITWMIKKYRGRKN